MYVYRVGNLLSVAKYVVGRYSICHRKLFYMIELKISPFTPNGKLMKSLTRLASAMKHTQINVIPSFRNEMRKLQG